MNFKNQYPSLLSKHFREGLKRQKTSECPSPPTESVLEWSTPEQHEWPLSTIVQYLLEDVLSTEWEHRHGAAIGLRSGFFRCVTWLYIT